jgi:hypothetical protein
MIDTLQKLYDAMGNPDLQEGDNIVDMAVDAIKHTQDLRSGLAIVDGRYAELRASVRVKDRLLQIAAQVEVTLSNEVADLRGSNELLRDNLRISAGIEVESRGAEVELQDYANSLLDEIDTQRKIMKVIGVVECSDDISELRRRGTVCRLVDNFLAGYYND